MIGEANKAVSQSNAAEWVTGPYVSSAGVVTGSDQVYDLSWHCLQLNDGDPQATDMSEFAAVEAGFLH